MPFFHILFGYCFALSLVAFFLYVLDKFRARRGAWRIPEAALLSLGFFGGAFGALLAMKLVRHKTKHGYFYAVNILGIIWQILLLAYLFTQGI